MNPNLEAIKKIQKRYNPERDVAIGPEVTWAEMGLACVIEILIKTIGILESRIEALEAKDAPFYFDEQMIKRIQIQ